MGKFGRSFALAKASWAVLLAEKEMLVYTGLGAVFTLVAVAVFAIPGILLYVVSGDTTQGAKSLGPVQIVLLFFLYLVISFITLFFNTALVGAALERLRGGNPALATGFQIASRNLGHIFVFAIVSATVGVILAVIEEKFEFVGQIVASIVGGAWGIVTFLVVPVMVAEGTNPFAAIKRSAQLLRKTWGEQIIGSGGIGLVLMLFALLGVIPIVLAALTGVVALIIAGVVIAVAYWAVLALVGSALNGIFRAAVYLYAETGATPSQFDGGLLRDAFRAKPGSQATGNI
jgi:Family of unknown function (DUF6159)